MTGLETVALLAAAGGTALKAVGDISAGRAAAEASATEAAAMQQKANWERATAQHQAERRRQEAERLMSRQRALYAASGGGVGDTALTVIGNTAAEGDLQSRIDIAMGEERARGIDDQAALRKRSGQAAWRGSLLQAGGTILDGVGKMAGPYIPRTGSTSGWRTYTTARSG